MKRVIRAFIGVCIVALMLASWSSRPTGTATAVPSRLETALLAHLHPAAIPLGPAPEPRFTREIYAATQLTGAAVMLDACAGPIAVELGADRPVLIAQHDYCGGSSWMPKVNVGEAVRLKGDGIEPGIYVVTEIRFQLRHRARVRDLPEGDAVLQTCVSKTKMILVGLEKFGSTLTS